MRACVDNLPQGQWDKDDFTQPKKKKRFTKNRRVQLKDDVTIDIGDDSAKSVQTPELTTPTSATTPTSITTPTTESSATGEGIGGKVDKLQKKAKKKAKKAEEKAKRAKEKAKKGMLELEYQLDKIDGLTDESMSEKHAEFLRQKQLEEERQRQLELANADDNDRVVSMQHLIARCPVYSTSGGEPREVLQSD